MIENKKRHTRNISITVVIAVFALIVSGCLITRSKPFGQLPQGNNFEKIKKSPNYQYGKFQNETPTSLLPDSVTWVKALWEFAHKDKRVNPIDPIPTQRTDINTLPLEKNFVVWMGHSSSYLQLAKKRILIDPVFSKYASPFSFFNKAYKGTNIYQSDDMPEMDVILISHDHWDHLDYPTMASLQSKVKKVICGIGTGEHLRRWGYREDQIEERNWYQEVRIDSSLNIIVTPARHGSGRALKTNQALWVSFVIQSGGAAFFYSGDTGYSTHFKDIGDRFGPFKLVLMECGQYDKYFKYIHMQPEQSLQAGLDLRAQLILPVHWARFTENNHGWTDPADRISLAAEKVGMQLITPMIGQAIQLDSIPNLPHWWKNVR